MNSVHVLGIPLYNKTLVDAVQELRQDVLAGNPPLNRCMSATGGHGLVYAQRNPDFALLLNRFYRNLPDGMPGVWIGRLKGAKNMRRCPGPDFFEAVMKATASDNINHFFCGGREGVAQELKEACRVKFANQHVVGVYTPPFRPMTTTELQALAAAIEHSGADVVWLGISTPKQEMLAEELCKYLKTSYVIAVGAAFDFHTDRAKKAPKWIGSIGLEWLYRLLMEPRRLYKRYAVVVPLFLWYNLCEFYYFCTSENTK